MVLPIPPFSYIQEQGDGTKTSYTLTFPFIDRGHVLVFKGTTAVSEGTGADEFQWEDDTKIKFNTAPLATDLVTIRRETKIDDQIVDWTDGSHLIADDLNTSDKQWLFLLQEQFDAIVRIWHGLAPIPGPGIPGQDFSFWNNLARNKDSNKGTATETAQTIDKTDQLKGDAVPGSVQNGEDKYVLTLGAIAERLDVMRGDGSSYPGAGNIGQTGKFRVDASNKLFFWDGALATPAWVEVIGKAGPPGQAATVDVGSTTTLDAGQDATVTNSGTNQAAVLDFGIPKGPKGDKGDPGKDGTGAGTVTEVKGGPGITSDGDSATPKVSVDLADSNPGLEFVAAPGQGADAAGLKVKVKSGGGITLDADGLSTSAGGGFVKLDDGGTQQVMQSKGLALGIPKGDPVVIDKLWNFEILSGGTRPRTWFKSEAGAGAHDVRIGDDINANSPWIGNNAKGHGISLQSGDVTSGNELNPPRLTIQSSTKNSNTDTAFLLNGGHTGGTVNKAIEFFYDGSAVFEKSVEAHNKVKISNTNGSISLDLSGASAHYEYEFPPAQPGQGNNWTLMCDRADANVTKCDMVWRQAFTQAGGDDRYLINSNVPGVSTGQGGGDTMIGQLTLGAAAISTGSSIVATSRAVPNNTQWSLGATNVWTIPANATVLFPLDTNLNIGPPENQCGIFVLQGDGISWTDTDANRGWRFPGGNVIGGTAGQRTIVPFIVTAQGGLNNIQINLGNPTVCEAQ